MLRCGRVQQCQQLSVEYDFCVVAIFIALFSRFRIFQNIDYWHFSPFYSPPFSCSPPLTPKHPDSFIHIVQVLSSLVEASLRTWKQSLMRRKDVLCLWRAEKRHLMNTAIIAMRGRDAYLSSSLSHICFGRCILAQSSLFVCFVRCILRLGDNVKMKILKLVTFFLL